MDDKKKKTPPQEGAAAPARKPIKVIMVDNVSASVFAHEHASNGEIRTFHSVAFSRSYRDSSDKRRYINSFNLDDLGKVVSVAQQADEYIRALTQPQIA